MAGGDFFVIAFAIRQKFVFSFASLPTFGARALLEILQAHVSAYAVVRADRSTFSFIRTLTIPLLFGVDLFLGYAIGFKQGLGVGIIVLTLLFLFFNHGISKKGIWWTLAGAINAVFTISLFKYDITHYNSIEAEQLLISVILLLYFAVIAKIKFSENPILFIFQKRFFVQSSSYGIASIFGSFAYGFAPASIIIAVERSTSVIWAVFSGNFYFREKGLLIKIITALFLVGGFILLMV